MIAVIPTAGGDDAFKERGYPYCKPLTEIHGRTMIERVWQSLAPLAAERHVFVIRKEDARRAHLADVLKLMDPGCAVVAARGPTHGNHRPEGVRAPTAEAALGRRPAGEELKVMPEH